MEITVDPGASARRIVQRWRLATLGGLLAAPLLARGAPRAPVPQDHSLQSDVELCFTIVDDAKAEAKMVEVAALFAADPEKLLKAVTTPPDRASGEAFELRVPFGGVPLAVAVAPPKQAPVGAPPVVLDLSWNTVASALHLEGAALCGVAKYTPDEFSDAGRDSFRKILQTVSFTLGGDPDRLWLAGFSWAGHAGFDVAEHRPGLVRGFVALGGGPRRNHWRLLANLAATRVISCVGAKDDPELVWNLKELAHVASSLHLDVHFTLDPDGGHKLPLKGMDEVAALVDATPARPAVIPKSGTLLADANQVALPWLEMVEVDPAVVAVPAKIPVNAAASPDEQRRATIRAMAGNVARIDWKLAPSKTGVALALTGKGVRKAALFLKAPWFDPAQELTVTANGKKIFDGKIAIDPATLLREARRTGDRQRPTVMRIDVAF